MINNYFKIAWRNLIRNKALSIINIIGLSFSIAFCLLLFMYISQEQSFDSFHKKKDRLFRLEMTNLFAKLDTTAKQSFLSSFFHKDEVENQLVFPLMIAGDIQANFPEIKSVTRFQDYGEHFIRVNRQVFKEDHVLYADANFFSNFSFRLKQGGAKTVFSSVNNVVLSETTAIKYFGNENAIGKIIELRTDSVQLFTVTGVVEDAPVNSSIQYNIIIPLLADPDYAYNMQERFNHSTHLTIVELANNVSVSQFEQKLNVWVKKYFAEYLGSYKEADITKFHWYLRPLTQAHYNPSHPWGHYTDAGNVYELFCLVVVILLIASLNYVLLAISNAASRTQEVGIRKIMGANRWLVILQFWIETQLVVTIAVLAGAAIASLLLPLFNAAIGSQLSFSNFSWMKILPAIAILTLVLGLIAGYYPALIISKMKPVSIIKSFQTFKINPRFSKTIVVVQFACCIVLMIAAFVITLQMRYISRKDLGFNKDQILMVKNPTWDNVLTQRLHDRLSAFAATQPSVIQFSGMNGGLNGSYNSNGFKLNGEQKWLRQLTVDYNYFEMLGLKFVQGRSFSKSMASDTSKMVRASVVNETLFRMLGKEAKMGVYNDAIRSTIIGVVKDYHFESLTKQIEPEQHVLVKSYQQYFMFKVKAEAMQKTIIAIEKEWKTITTDYPFEYSFLDETVAQMYEPQKRWQMTIQASCFFAIFIACMGLFGLSAINAINRTKEIGIRKVLGASVSNIIKMLSAKFFSMVGISILIATPLAWWLMNSWLHDFAYRIEISWWMFASVGLIAVFVALLTTSIQAIKAAIANPVKSLRTD